MMATQDEKLIKIEYLNNKNLGRVDRNFTGSHTVHWKDGEPLKEEEKKANNIKL